MDGMVVVLCVMLMVSNNLLLPVMSSTFSSLGDEKNYYSIPTTPSFGVHSNPSHHGSSSTRQSNCVPPSHGGGGGHYYPTPKPPSHGGGSGGCHCDPTTPTPTPTTPIVSSPPLVPSPPISGGGGGYYGPPTTPIVSSPPPIVSSPPFEPLVPSPPLYPITPPTPTTPTPYDPIHPPFPCTYWGTHPKLIFGVLGWWATLGGLFGVAAIPNLNAADISLQQILTSTRRDPYSSLYKEATASLLNSMATKHFPYSTNQVKSSFISALSTTTAAATQARLFRLANEGKLKHVANNMP